MSALWQANPINAEAAVLRPGIISLLLG